MESVIIGNITFLSRSSSLGEREERKKEELVYNFNFYRLRVERAITITVAFFPFFNKLKLSINNLHNLVLMD